MHLYIYMSVAIYSHIYIYIYVYVCVRVCVCACVRCGVISWSKFGLFNSYYLVQFFGFKTVSQKHYKIGFQQIFEKMCTQIIIVIIWSKLAFLFGQLGPDNNPTLDQITTIKNGHFLFFVFKNVLKYLV